MLNQELMGNVTEGQKKKDLAAEKMEVAKAALPKDKQSDLDQQKAAADKEWNDFVNQIQSTQ